MYDTYRAAPPPDASDTDVLYACPTCKTVYELVRYHLRPPVEPHCEICQQALPLADEADWLAYRRIKPRR